jgi:hypothetical protein
MFEVADEGGGGLIEDGAEDGGAGLKKATAIQQRAAWEGEVFGGGCHGAANWVFPVYGWI